MSSEIANVFRDKCVFITGGTGFVGKVLVEKLLRSCAEVKYIYLLIRPKKGMDTNTRLKTILRAPIFEKLFQSDPNFINKVIPIEGDITLPGLGLSQQNLKILIRDVSIVFHSAATVTFDEPLKTAIEFNLLGTKKVIELCRKLTKLEVLIYVSTAYSNCNRQEIEEKIYSSTYKPQDIIDLCEMSDEELKLIIPSLLNGFPNSYTYSKSLAENLLFEEGSGLPIAIIRPSAVIASWKEPLPGWIDNGYHLTFLMIAIGKGFFRHIMCKKNCSIHLIPVDIVVNLMIAMVWYKTTKSVNNTMEVFNCVPDLSNTPVWSQVLVWLKTPYSIENPSEHIYRYPFLYGTESQILHKILTFIDHLIPAHLYDTFMYLMGKERTMVNYHKTQNHEYDKISWAFVKQLYFSNNNVVNLEQMLNSVDKEEFNFNTQTLDWSAYFTNYWWGIKKFIFKENNMNLAKAKENINYIYWRDISIFISIVVLTVFSILIFRLFL